MGKTDIVIRTPAIPEHRYNLNTDQVALIKRTIAKGATDDELQLFLWVAKRHRLDPFTRQLHLVRRWDKNADAGEGKKGAYVATIQVGIDGYRQMASRYPDFGSVSAAEYGPIVKDGMVDVPEWASVKVYKKGMTQPSVGTAFWHEYAPDLTQSWGFFWKKMPKHMLAKCAEALALRKAHPDLADIYTTDEMARSNAEITAGGRTIELAETAQTEAEKNWEAREAEGISKLNAEQKAIVERKTAEAKSKAASKGLIEIYWASDGKEVAQLRGDPSALAALLPVIQKECLAVWLEGARAWTLPITDVPKVKEICARHGYQFQETQALGQPTPTGAPSGAREKQPEPTTGTGAAPTSQGVAASVVGVIKQVQQDQTSEKKIPILRVNIGGQVLGCFVRTLWEYLTAGKGMEAELIVKGARRDIVGIKRINKRMFDEDGKTPVISNSEDRPTHIGALFT